jgi:hypothetical protein
MTWTKLSDDFGDQCAGLSDQAFRTHAEGLLWVMRRETGGWITDRDVRRFAESSGAAEAVTELVSCGFWSMVDGGYRIEHGMADQVEVAVIEARRRTDALRQQKRRRKAAGLAGGDEDDPSRRDTPRDSRRDTQRDDLRDPGLVGSGLDGEPNYTTGLDTKESEPAALDGEVCSTPGCVSCGFLLAGRCRSCHFDSLKVHTVHNLAGVR